MKQFDEQTLDILTNISETIAALDGIPGMPTKKKMIGALLIFLGMRDEIATRAVEHETVRRALALLMQEFGKDRIEYSIAQMDEMVTKLQADGKMLLLEVGVKEGKFIAELTTPSIGESGKEGGLKIER